MRFPSHDQAEELKLTWTDQFVRVKPGFAQYARFEGRIGRVVTVNYGGRALVDFADGAWYDIPASDEFLEILAEGADHSAYDATVNTAQALPIRQA